MSILHSKVQGDDQDQIPIVDTHQHLWDKKIFQPPWHADAPDVLTASHDTSHYLDATKGMNFVKSVYMEIDLAPEQKLKEAHHLIELCKSDQHPTAAAVISGQLQTAEFAAYISQFKGSPYIKGVRQILQDDRTPQGFCLQNPFIKSIQLLGELGMCFDVCMRPMELADGAKLAAECPGTRFIVDHCGNGDPKSWLAEDQQESKPWHDVATWKKGMEAMSKQPNVVCKISGIVARAPQAWQTDHLAPIVEFCWDAFGPDRVMFGSDWPVCKLRSSIRQWVQALQDIVGQKPFEQRRKLFHDNASKFYHLG